MRKPTQHISKVTYHNKLNPKQTPNPNTINQYSATKFASNNHKNNGVTNHTLLQLQSNLTLNYKTNTTTHPNLKSTLPQTPENKPTYNNTNEPNQYGIPLTTVKPKAANTITPNTTQITTSYSKIQRKRNLNTNANHKVHLSNKHTNTTQPLQF